MKRVVGHESNRGFMEEIRMLGRIRHRNIVRLLGYMLNKQIRCYMSIWRIGVWERCYMALKAHLQWDLRCRIALDAAIWLSYLHHDCSPSIIRRDVKSNNILLNGDFEAHVVDLGLAKFWRDGFGASECMSAVASSYGYIAPDRKPVGDFGDVVDIVSWVKESKLDTEAVLAMMDSRLAAYPVTDVVNLLKIAMACVEEESSAQPTILQIVNLHTTLQRFTPTLDRLLVKDQV